jgi:hypothetical protein
MTQGGVRVSTKPKNIRLLEEKIAALEEELRCLGWYYARHWDVPPALAERVAQRAMPKHLVKALTDMDKAAARAWTAKLP